MKSTASLSAANQLDALANTARGEKSVFGSGRVDDGDNDSVSSDSIQRRMDPANHPLPPSTAGSAAQRNSFRSLHESGAPGGSSLPAYAPDGEHSIGQRGISTSGSGVSHARPSSSSYVAENNSGPWQRGAGYE
jgi:hypothetical protein